MAAKKEENSQTTSDLMEIIKTWKISQRVLAEALYMPLSVFKNKLYQTQASYFFSDDELIRISEIFIEMSAGLKSYSNKVKKQLTNISTSKK